MVKVSGSWGSGGRERVRLVYEGSGVETWGFCDLIILDIREQLRIMKDVRMRVR